MHILFLWVGLIKGVHSKALVLFWFWRFRLSKKAHFIKGSAGWWCEIRWRFSLKCHFKYFAHCVFISSAEMLILTVCTHTSSYKPPAVFSLSCKTLYKVGCVAEPSCFERKKKVDKLMIYRTREEAVIGCSLWSAFKSNKSKLQTLRLSSGILIILLYQFQRCYRTKSVSQKELGNFVTNKNGTSVMGALCC